MVMVALKCPFCQSENIRKYGFNNGKQRYLCENDECSHKTFYADYTYNAYTPAVRLQIIKMSIDDSGIRTIARVLKISTNTVMSVLKKRRIDFVC